MKIVLALLASAIAVFTADSRNFPDNPDGGGTAPDDGGGLRFANPDGPVDHTQADEPQTFNEEADVYSLTEVTQKLPEEPELRDSESEDQQAIVGTESFAEEFQFLVSGSPEEDHQSMKEGESQIERGLRDFQCEVNVMCGVLGGTCIANNTVCSGWRVSEGCKGTNCMCCIPVSLEIKMKNFGLELQSLKDDLANSSQQQIIELKSMITNITSTNAGLKEQIQSFTNSKINASLNFESQLNNLTQTNVRLQTELESIKADVSKQGCPASPKGLFYFAASDQCFKLLNTTRYNWATANTKCQEQGLELAKPYAPVALNHYLMLRYGNTAGYTWLGAKGDGSVFRWTRDKKYIWSSSMLWYNGASGTASTSKCLGMLSETSHIKVKPEKPYNTWSCSSSLWALCELVRKL